MSADSDAAVRSRLLRDVLEATIRVGLVLGLLLLCLAIVRPFVTPILWGFILAIAVAPAHERLVAALGGRRRLAAAVVVLVGLALFIVPLVSLSGTMIDSLHGVADAFRRGELRVPPPPPQVAEWPLVGKPVSALWSQAASNLESVLERLAPQLRVVGAWLLGAAASFGFGLLEFVFSLIVAGVVLATGERPRAGIERILRRLAGAQGHRFVELAESTIRSVATGIVGVALIQSMLAGIGLALAGVPAAGLWALLVLVCCIVQLGPALILLPVAIYLFATAETLPAVLFLVWSLFVGLLDNFLKPLLLGRGVDAPILVIFMGAIGGFLAMGIIGLFVGSVVLVLFQTLLRSWIDDEDSGADPAAQSVAAPPSAPGG